MLCDVIEVSGGRPEMPVDTEGLRYQVLDNHVRVWRDDGRDGITWDQLQAVKNEAVGEDCTCVEVYPPQGAVVNDVNMRHLWILPDDIPLVTLLQGCELVTTRVHAALTKSRKSG